MTHLFSVRRAAVGAALVTVAGSALVLPAAPAFAAPAVDGYLDAYGYYRSEVTTCDFTPTSPVHDHKVFTGATGLRTAHVAQSFAAAPSVGALPTAEGRVENDTAGKADVNNGAFNTVEFTARHLVRVSNRRASDCGLGLIADSQSGADVHVKHRGRVRVEWDRGAAGQIEEIYVARDSNNNVLVDKIRPRRHGHLSFAVHRGNYTVFVQFVTRANERDIAVHSTLTKRASFSVLLDYHS